MLGRPDPEGNLIANGRFDAGLGGWEGSGDDLRIGSDCRSGACAEFVSRGGGGFIAHWRAATLRPGVVYEYKAWIKSASPDPQPWLFGIWDPTAVRWVACNLVSATPEWREVRLTFRNDSSNPVGTEFIKNSPKAGALIVDEVVLREAGTPQ
jgi:hypothetical protein